MGKDAIKYNTGDRVVVRDDLVAGKDYGNGVYFVKSMKKFSGKVAIIERKAFWGYDIEGSHCNWVDDMFVGLAEEKTEKVEESVKMPKFKVGDKVKVRSDLVVWNSYAMENGDSKNSYVDDMDNFRGEVVTISYADERGYRIEGDEVYYTWTDKMFEDTITEEEVVKLESTKPEVIDLTGDIVRMEIQLQKVIYSKPATIIFYKYPYDPEGTVRKMVARCLPTDEYSKEKGKAAAILKAMRKLVMKQFKQL